MVGQRPHAFGDNCLRRRKPGVPHRQINKTRQNQK